MRRVRAVWAALGCTNKQFPVPHDCEDEVLGSVARVVGRHLLEIADDGHATDLHALMADKRRRVTVSPGEIAAMEVEVSEARRKSLRDLLEEVQHHNRMYHHNYHLTTSPPSGSTREELAQWYARAYAHSWALAGAYYSLRAEVAKHKKSNEQ